MKLYFPRLSGLRGRLVLLLGLAVLPAAALLFAGRLEGQRVARRELEVQALNLARLTAQAHAQRIEVARQLLISLSNNPVIRGENLDECDRLVRSLARQYEGIYATIGRADINGTVDCLALDGAPRGLSIEDREYFQRAKSTGAFVTGDFMQGKIRKEPTLAFSLPVYGADAKLTHVLFANADLRVLSRSLEANTQMEGTTISLLDRNSSLIARSVNADQFFGIKASDGQLRVMRERREMVSTFEGPDGIRRTFAIAAIRDRNDAVVAFATVGVPETTIAAAIDPGARRDWFTIGVLALGLFLVAWVGSEILIRRPIDKLVSATRSLAAGELGTRTAPVGGVHELEVLASAFNQMAGELQERDVHLREGQRLEAVGQLAGGIAHDFNNLLTVIIGYTDALTERVCSDRTAIVQLNGVREASEKAAKLTQQLLAFSRRQVLLPATLQLNEVIEEMVSLLRRTTGGAIAIDVILAPDLGFVHADRMQMEQVILNLVINARDAIPAGGRITLETCNFRDAAAAFVEFSVSDTGVGIDSETKRHIFEPFFTTKGVDGTGLGLATVYGIVKQSGGDIVCDSAPGERTVFRVRLPRLRGQVERPQIAQVEPPVVGGTETIVLVDDNEAVRTVLQLALVRRGYDVRATGSGAEVLEWFREGLRPALLLTDIRMPEIGGDVLARQVRSFNPDQRIILMSGDATPSLMEPNHDGRMVFLQKPVTANLLLRTVRGCLDEVVRI